MDDSTSSAVIEMAKRALLELPRSAQAVTLHAGSVWITQDGDIRDILLEPGQSFHPDARKRTLVYGLSASVLALHTPAALGRATSGRAAPRPTRSLAVSGRVLAQGARSGAP